MDLLRGRCQERLWHGAADPGGAALRKLPSAQRVRWVVHLEGLITRISRPSSACRSQGEDDIFAARACGGNSPP